MSARDSKQGFTTMHAVMTAHAVLYDRLERRLQETVKEASLSWLEVLALLKNAPNETARMQELADHMVLTKSGVTRLIERMEAKGLVERRRCPSDRRGVDVAPTAAGLRLFGEAEPVLLAATEEHFGKHLSSKELKQLQAMLNRVLAANGYTPHEPAIDHRATKGPTGGGDGVAR